MEGPGIRVNRGNLSKIKGNSVSFCKCGIEIISAQPTILMNKFFKNYESGIHSMAKKDLRCDCQILYNDVQKNKENGIHCEGEFNNSIIAKNLNISQNSKAGIKISDSANVTIVNNTI